MSNLNIPVEEISLPSKGLVYPESNPLSSGIVEMKYMTAKEEDILTNQSYIQKGNVLEKLLESMTNGKIKADDLVPGDKNALLIASRILGYGKNYRFSWKGEDQEIDLTTLDNRPFEPKNQLKPYENEFSFTLPHSGVEVTYKLLTGSDENKITRELEGLKKIDKKNTPELTTRLKFLIKSVDGDSDTKTIRDFVDNHLLAIDSKALRDAVKQNQPNVNTTIQLENDEEIELPITTKFFWPD